MKYLSLIGLILGVVAILLPFVSDKPDGLEKVAEKLYFIEKEKIIFNGLMPDYKAFGNNYFSSLFAALVGIAITLLLTFIVIFMINASRIHR